MERECIGGREGGVVGGYSRSNIEISKWERSITLAVYVCDELYLVNTCTVVTEKV